MQASQIPGFELLVGPLLVLTCIALMCVLPSTRETGRKLTAMHSLYGVVSAQSYFYWTTYTKDPLRLRLFVLIVWYVCGHLAFFWYASLTELVIF